MPSSKPYISVVTPVYRCEACLQELYRRLCTTLEGISPFYQIIFVNDQSPDGSWRLIQELAHDPRVVGINLSRNFGQHAAITAGLDHADGEWVVVMDCDLQDVPEEIVKLHDYAQQQQLDVVFGRRVARQDSFSKRTFSKLFFQTLSYLSGTEQDSSTANFGIFHHKVVEALRHMREPIRAFPIHVKWVGFRRGAVDVVHAARAHGTSSYSFRRLINLALDIILAFSDKPLRLAVKMGMLISAAAFLFALYVVVRAMAGSYAVLGYASLIASIWFLSGLLIFVVGLIGLYVGKTFEGVKNRPLYVIRDVTSAGSSPFSVL